MAGFILKYDRKTLSYLQGFLWPVAGDCGKTGQREDQRPHWPKCK